MMTVNADAGEAGVFSLVISSGSGRGKTIGLEAGREYVIGRSEQCDIRIDASDKTVSRKHARLKIEKGFILLENLSGTNPVQFKGNTIDTAVLQAGGKFLIGETVFAVKAPQGENRVLPFRFDRMSYALAALAALGLVLVMLMVVMKKDHAVQPASVTGPGPEMPAITPEPRSFSASPDLHDSSGVAVSEQHRQAADQHFHQGLFLYDAGNLFRAIIEWERALEVNPGHNDARLWFLRAEEELEDIIKTHYQNAMLHYKYMRYERAVHEFNMVVALSRDKNSDQYINAMRYIDELRRK